MKSKGIFIDCLYRKEGGHLPCNHPIVGEEMKDLLFDSAHLAFANAYARIRKRLDLKFEERSWNVKGCSGKESLSS